MTPATERLRAARVRIPESRQGWRAVQARSSAASMAAWSASGNDASSRPVAGSRDFSTPSNHGTRAVGARSPGKRRPGRPAATPTPAGPPAPPDEQDGRKRVVIEAVMPEVDAGRFPARRVTGETVTVEADVFADGHDTVVAVLRYRHQSAGDWVEVPIAPLPSGRA